MPYDPLKLYIARRRELEQDRAQKEREAEQQRQFEVQRQAAQQQFQADQAERANAAKRFAEQFDFQKTQANVASEQQGFDLAARGFAAPTEATQTTEFPAPEGVSDVLSQILKGSVTVPRGDVTRFGGVPYRPTSPEERATSAANLQRTVDEQSYQDRLKRGTTAIEGLNLPPALRDRMTNRLKTSLSMGADVAGMLYPNTQAETQQEIIEMLSSPDPAVQAEGKKRAAAYRQLNPESIYAGMGGVSGARFAQQNEEDLLADKVFNQVLTDLASKYNGDLSRIPRNRLDAAVMAAAQNPGMVPPGSQTRVIESLKRRLPTLSKPVDLSTPDGQRAAARLARDLAAEINRTGPTQWELMSGQVEQNNKQVQEAKPKPDRSPADPIFNQIPLGSSIKIKSAEDDPVVQDMRQRVAEELRKGRVDLQSAVQKALERKK